MNTNLQPELLYLTRREPLHPVVRSVVSNLLEHGIAVAFDDQQALPGTLPAELQPYKAILFDQSMAEPLANDPEAMRRLRDFAAAGGVVNRMEEPFLEPPRAQFNTNAAIDFVAHSRAHDVILHGDLTRWHPWLAQQQQGRSLDAMLDAAKQHTSDWLTKRLNSFQEKAYQCFEVSKALVDHGEQAYWEPMMAALRRITATAEPMPHHHADTLGGAIAAVWLYEQTGERGPLDRVIEMVRDAFDRRPRSQGLMGGAGFKDDPLLSDTAASLGNADPLAYVNHGLRWPALWTEFTRYHCGLLPAITRVTGDPRYLEEAQRVVEHLYATHLRADGLLGHISRDGRLAAPVWARGLAHALYGLRSMLLELPADHPARHRVTQLLDLIGRGLMRYQDATTGLWRNVIDNPHARLETSGTDGFVITYATCINRGWLDAQTFGPMVERAWRGMRRMYWHGGICTHCRGTSAGIDQSYYLARPQGWAPEPQLTMTILEIRTLLGADA